MIETPEQLRRIMVVLGITQAELGEAMGRDRNYVSNLTRFGIPKKLKRELNDTLQKLIDKRVTVIREAGFKIKGQRA